MFKLQYYKTKFGNLAPQGSTEWLNGRKIAFGGSEMATVLGNNKYETWKDLKNRKLHSKLELSDITEWGRWFEPVSKLYISKDYGQIHEFGSIPHCFYPVCYSPDGIIVENNDLTLLEIKNPIMRGIYSIPEHYMYQVKTGMCVINVKYTLFVQCRFRRCKFGSKPWDVTYDRHYHKEYRKRQKDKKPMSYGYLYWETEDPLFDLSCIDNMCQKLGSAAYRKPEIIVEKEFKPEKGFVLMWKLFEIHQIGIRPDPDFLKEREDELWAMLEDLWRFNIMNEFKYETNDISKVV